MLDLRYLTWTTDDCLSSFPKIDLKVTDMSDRGLLGSAVTSDFALEEGQVIIFVLRESREWQYDNDYQRSVAHPDREKAESLKVPMSLLLDAASKLRHEENPIMTRVS